MSDYISREAFLAEQRHLYCENCARRKNSKGKLVYDIGDAPCRDCVNWQAPIAYTSTGKCELHDRITNRNFYCGDGREKDG